MSGHRKLLAAAGFVLFSASAAFPCFAQGRGGGGPGGGMPHGGMGGQPGMGGGIDNRPLSNPPFGRSPDVTGGATPASGGTNPSSGTTRGGLQLGPPGRWWDDKSFAKSLKLRSDQQARMDAIFEQNRPSLLARYQNLQQAESQMEEIGRNPSPDESTLFAGIDHVAQARAEVEKAYAHMQLMIRKEMDPEQLDRLEKHH